eukprot:scaffold268_cov210-Ochromonas_danica.AAC.12
MTVYDLPATSNWSKLLRDHGLLGFFTRMLVPGLAQNDLLLEIIMLITTTATDSQARTKYKLLSSCFMLLSIGRYCFILTILLLLCGDRLAMFWRVAI